MEVQEIVRKAITTFGELFPNEMKKDLRLEEVRLSDDEAIWSTTVSFKNPDTDDELALDQQSQSVAALLGVRRHPRKYKTVTLRSGDGQLLGIVDAK